MHELSLAENAIALIEDAARREGFAKVLQVRMEVGALSCVEPDALQFAFVSAAQGTCAEGALLQVLRVPGEGVCRACGLRAVIDSVYDLCTGCGNGPVDVVSGTQLRVKDLDVE